MGISLRPDRLKRYKDLAQILFKYGRADLVTRAGLDEVLQGERVADDDEGGPNPDGLPRELEQLGPAFVKLGQLLSTRALRDEAASLMQRRMWQSASPGSLFSAALETKEFLEKLPGRVNKLLDAVANNEVKLNVEVMDEQLVIEGLEKIANRITLGLLLAALIVGAAMLMRVDTPFRLFGYPGFAMLFFLAAASGGIWLAVNILRSDRTPRRR